MPIKADLPPLERVTARYIDATGKLHAGAAVEESISLRPETIAGFVNVAFTRGFASSLAYADRFNNETGILPPVNAPAKASLSHDMTPFRSNTTGWASKCDA